MKRSALLFATFVIFTACSGKTTSIIQQNENPLIASRYGDELADTMANFVIAKDPIADDEAARKLIDEGIATGKQIAEDARARQSKGLLGAILPVKGDTVGYGLLLDGTLYLSSDFSSAPGLNLHVYLTTAVDPRDAQFPDDTAVDLGTIQAVFGAQQYAVSGNTEKLRTLVFWDATLKQLYGFAQLQKTN
jgi:hypothetical protein